ncbi:peptide chain release factor 2 [Acetoanaerobium pronyense]|uniref:Peptide chain release factor 2 n=2 Tax=Acetoanaerobium pronyense TaxID=1482736 RepID=A0ABS4KKT8_9FIRM|nr:peptide chain release factor 2 [Acetoanaerobium pronyense]
MTEQGFWDDVDKAQGVMQKSKALDDKIGSFKSMEDEFEEVEILFELSQEDQSMEKELKSKIEEVYKKIEDMKIATLLDGPYDINNAILSIHAGSGGLDAQDWAKMLLRMYDRFAENMGFKVIELDLISDPEAGIKSVTLKIEGFNAYGYLKSEKGVHRIVRISPFDTSGKRHTSFASVDVIPELDDSVEIDINPTDLKIDTYRASGAGGQHVNKTESAIRITHLPTGIVVQCQNQRSQHSNKETAMKMLMAKLIELKELEHKDKIEDIQGEYSQISWGSQIRSYVFQPYTMVKDHRTNEEIGNIQSVMDGNLMPFMNAYLQHIKNQG